MKGDEESVNGYSTRIEVKEERLQKIFERLNKAQEEIYACYSELANLGAVTFVKEELPLKNSDSSKN